MNEEEKIEKQNAESEKSKAESQFADGAGIENTASRQPVESTEPIAISEQPTTENMEVHHHPHVEKKNFEEYFLEFLMIFLAVTMGFFAESLRQHLSDKRIERQYIRSFVEDLKQDTATFSRTIPLGENNIKGIDSLLNTLLATPYTDSSIRLIYYLKETYADRIYPMSYSTRTITQLKNAGGLRLITDKRSSDSINVYNLELDDVNWVFNALQRDFSIPTIRLANKIYNPQFLIPYEREPSDIILHSQQKMALLTQDQSLISEYINSLAWDRKVKQLSLNTILAHQQLALRLITFFSKEYNLK